MTPEIRAAVRSLLPEDVEPDVPDAAIDEACLILLPPTTAIAATVLRRARWAHRHTDWEDVKARRSSRGDDSLE
jgi:hypothetical protein